MATVTRLPVRQGMLVKLIDRELLVRLMKIRGLTDRALAAKIGWKSHTYVGRLRRGENSHVEPAAALLIAHELQVPLDYLFAVKTSSEIGTIAVRNRKAS
jgi:transcriptional regulator with XRE-family HTH domain